MSRKLIFIFSILVFGTAMGQPQDPSKDLKVDDSSVVVNDFAEDFQQEYDGSDFDYEKEGASSDNFISRMIDSFLQWLQDLFGFEMDPETYEVIETILYVILIAVGLYFMVRLLLGHQATSFLGGKNTALAPLRTQEEDLTQIDLQALIDDALKQSDYRLAVRYMFLKALKDLSGKKLIEWHFEKTNKDYLSELESPVLKDNFKAVSRLYDYIWYGEFPINKERFVKAEARFDQLQKSIRKHG